MAPYSFSSSRPADVRASWPLAKAGPGSLSGFLASAPGPASLSRKNSVGRPVEQPATVSSGMAPAPIIEALLHVLRGVSTSNVGTRPLLPSERATQTILAERSRTELEKYQFTPEEHARAAEWNAEVDRKNTKTLRRMAELEQDLRDPKNATDPGRREKLEAKIQELRQKIIPRLDLTDMTARVDQIMNDPSLSRKEKERAVNKLRKDHDLPKRGPFGMRSMITHRLGTIYKESRDRLKAAEKTHREALETQLTELEAIYGKESPEVQAFKMEMDTTEKLYDQEIDRLHQLARTLQRMYRRKRFFQRLRDAFKKAFRFIGKILDFAMPIIRFIPGVGQIAGLVHGGLKAIGSAIRGDWKGVLGALGGAAIPGVGGALGALGKGVSQVAGKAIDGVKSLLGNTWNTIEKASGYVRSGVQFVNRASRGDWAGALGSLSGLANTAALDGVAPSVTSTLGDVTRQTSQALRAAERFSQGDVMGGLQGLGGVGRNLADPEVAARHGDVTRTTSQVLQAGERIARGDVAGGLRGLGGVGQNLVDPEVAARLGNVTSPTSQVLRAGERFARGDVMGGLQGLDGVGQTLVGRGMVPQPLQQATHELRELVEVHPAMNVPRNIPEVSPQLYEAVRASIEVATAGSRAVDHRAQVEPSQFSRGVDGFTFSRRK